MERRRVLIVVLPGESADQMIRLVPFSSGYDITVDAILIRDRADGEEQCLVPEHVNQAICIVGTQFEHSWDMEPFASAVFKQICGTTYDVILLNASYRGDRLAPLLSHWLGGKCLNGASGFAWGKSGIKAKKMVYGMNLTATFEIEGTAACLTIACSRQHEQPKARKKSVIATVPESSVITQWYTDLIEKEIDESICFGAKRKLIVVGRGITAAQYDRTRLLARLLDAELGTTRPLVLQAIAPHETLVGISGTTVSPEKCLVLGVSGAAAFALGVIQSGTIIGVNIDPHAPLLSFCDHIMIGDAGELIEEMIRQLEPLV